MNITKDLKFIQITNLPMIGPFMLYNGIFYFLVFEPIIPPSPLSAEVQNWLFNS